MMNNDIAISIRNLTKTYSKNSQQGFFKKKNNSGELFNAVDNINLEIKKGETICISGHNGSGKSTLLKMIAEVTLPTSGEIEIDGKVASILEIGIGFQPEISGYENIFLSGAMYGLSKSQIEAKLDRIIDMFGFPEFVNTPVKYYSSGMYMRLAFSIIVNIDADIYLFDEVTSVGDIEFRNKVIKEISRLKQQKSTTLIVTHAPSLFSKISDKFIQFDKGQIKVFDSYENASSTGNQNDSMHLNESAIKLFKETFDSKCDFDINDIQISTPSMDEKKVFEEEITITTKVSYSSESERVMILAISEITGNIITSAMAKLSPGKADKKEISYKIPQGYLKPAPYSLSFEILDEDKTRLISYTNIINVACPKKEKWAGLINIPIEVNC